MEDNHIQTTLMGWHNEELDEKLRAYLFIKLTFIEQWLVAGFAVT